MFAKKDIIFLSALILFPIIPSLLISSTIEIKEVEIKNDPYRKKINNLDIQNILWLDARSRVKYENRHIPGAVLVNAKEWEESLARLFEVFEPGKTIVVYCNKGCTSSSSIAQRLRNELGQDNIYYLEGGMDSWFSNTAD